MTIYFMKFDDLFYLFLAMKTIISTETVSVPKGGKLTVYFTNKQDFKRMLFNRTRQYNIKKFYIYILHHAEIYIQLNVCKMEGNVLFNDALNTFYLRLYGVGHMVKDHSDRCL